jgi:HAMP domain-containing protein
MADTLRALGIWAGLWLAAALGAVLWAMGFRCIDDVEEARRAAHEVGDP